MELNYEKEKVPEFDLMDYWRVIVKRKGILIVFASTVILLVGIYSFTAPPKYKPSATLLIVEETSKMLSIDDEFGFAGYSNSFRDMMFINTQLTMLKSQSLAERVARKLELLSRPEFGAEVSKKSLFTRLKNIILLKWLRSKKLEENGEGMYLDPYLEIAEDLQKGFSASQIRDTKVLTIGYASKYPILATEIVNTFAEEFINFSIDKRTETTQQATDFLSEQIINLREDLATKERELQRYGQEKELFFLSDEENTAVAKLAELNNTYTQFQIERVRTESAYRVLQNATADSLPRTTENRVLQTLEEEYSKVRNEYAEKGKVYGKDHPEMKRLSSRIEGMREELENELNRARDTAQLQYHSALRKENQMKNLLTQQREDVARLNSNAIFYNSLKIEVENKRRLLDSLVEKQNETLVSARLSGLKTSNISIIDKAKVPKNPVSPKKKLNLLLAIIMGLFGGVGLCFVFEYMDNTLKGPDDVERSANIPSLGTIPYLPPEGLSKKNYRFYTSFEDIEKGEEGIEDPETKIPDVNKIELINHLHPQFTISEDYRTVRTSIMLSHAESPPQCLAFTSIQPKEGKTVTVANMAIAFSQLDKKVLIIDADLRKPRLHKLFDMKNTKGLSSYLSGAISLEEAGQKTHINDIWLLPSGPPPPNPAELLNSNKMKNLIEGMKNGFDFVLLDTPPISSLADSLIVGSLVDAVVLIVQPEKTIKKQFASAVEQLRKNNVKIIGVLFNQAKLRSKYDYRAYYPYS